MSQAMQTSATRNMLYPETKWNNVCGTTQYLDFIRNRIDERP